jgi:hypothetical protein
VGEAPRTKEVVLAKEGQKYAPGDGRGGCLGGSVGPWGTRVEVF